MLTPGLWITCPFPFSSWVHTTDSSHLYRSHLPQSSLLKLIWSHWTWKPVLTIKSKNNWVIQRSHFLLSPSSLLPSPGSHLQWNYNGVGMRLQMPATLATLGPHKILKLSNLFVEAIDILVRDQKKSIKQEVSSHWPHLCYPWQRGQDKTSQVSSQIRRWHWDYSKTVHSLQKKEVDGLTISKWMIYLPSTFLLYFTL